MTADRRYLDHLQAIASADVASIQEKDAEYGGSWKRRGGVGAFMMLCRKWDRLELAVAKHGWDVFAAAHADPRAEGIIDDVRDLRRYMLLVEAELEARRQAAAPPEDAPHPSLADF